MTISKYRLRRLKENVTGYLFCLPGLLLFLTVGFYSVCFSIFLSFFNWSGVDFANTARFVGFDNFKNILLGGDPIKTKLFYSGLLNNLTIGICLILCVIPIAMTVAFLLTRIKHAGIFRTAYFIPMVASGVGVFYVWRALFGAKGTINAIANTLGLSFLVVKDGIFGTPNTALIGVIITCIWGAIPGMMMLYYAGISNIDNTFYEAAQIDGANRFQEFLYITWPLLKSMTMIVLIQLLNSAFQMFENVWILTGGGPGGATDVVGTLIYSAAFKDNSYGSASAMGWSVFLITVILSVISIKMTQTDN